MVNLNPSSQIYFSAKPILPHTVWHHAPFPMGRAEIKLCNLKQVKATHTSYYYYNRKMYITMKIQPLQCHTAKDPTCCKLYWFGVWDSVCSMSYTFFHIGSSGSSFIASLHRITPFWRCSSSSSAEGSSSSRRLSIHLNQKTAPVQHDT